MAVACFLPGRAKELSAPPVCNSGFVWMLSVRVQYSTHIVSGEAALSSAGRSMVGSSFSSLAKLVRFANNVTTRNRISSFVEGSNKYINRRGALNKKVEGMHQARSTQTLALQCGIFSTTDISVSVSKQDSHYSIG